MHSYLDAQRRRPVQLGVAGAVLAFLIVVATVPEGRLPTLTTPLPADKMPLMPDDHLPRRIYVANHPPLFYALTAAPLGLGERFSSPRAGALAASATLVAAVVVVRRGPTRPRLAGLNVAAAAPC